MPLAPSAFTKNGCLRRQAINFAPRRRVRACGTTPWGSRNVSLGRVTWMLGLPVIRARQFRLTTVSRDVTHPTKSVPLILQRASSAGSSLLNQRYLSHAPPNWRVWDKTFFGGNTSGPIDIRLKKGRLSRQVINIALLSWVRTCKGDSLRLKKCQSWPRDVNARPTWHSCQAASADFWLPETWHTRLDSCRRYHCRPKYGSSL